MVKADIKEAYRHIPVHPENQQWESQFLLMGFWSPFRPKDIFNGSRRGSVDACTGGCLHYIHDYILVEHHESDALCSKETVVESSAFPWNTQNWKAIVLALPSRFTCDRCN